MSYGTKVRRYFWNIPFSPSMAGVTWFTTETNQLHDEMFIAQTTEGLLW